MTPSYLGHLNKIAVIGPPLAYLGQDTFDAAQRCLAAGSIPPRTHLVRRVPGRTAEHRAYLSIVATNLSAQHQATTATSLLLFSGRSRHALTFYAVVERRFSATNDQDTVALSAADFPPSFGEAMRRMYDAWPVFAELYGANYRVPQYFLWVDAPDVGAEAFGLRLEGQHTFWFRGDAESKAYSQSTNTYPVEARVELDHHFEPRGYWEIEM
jgi:hypothetical protein